MILAKVLNLLNTSVLPLVKSYRNNAILRIKYNNICRILNKGSVSVDNHYDSVSR